MEKAEFNLVAGDLNYLVHKGLIKGYTQMGLQYPDRVQITSKDIHELGRT